MIAVLEADVGAEYALLLGGARLFARANLVGQFYSGAGNAANNEMFVDTGFDETLDNGVNLGLFGLRLGAGVDY